MCVGVVLLFVHFCVACKYYSAKKQPFFALSHSTISEMSAKKQELESKEKAIREYLANYPILKSLLERADVRQNLKSSSAGLVD